MGTNGGQALIRALEMEGVEVIFGLPGGAILPVYDPLIDSPIRHVLVRHEQGAGHMAEGFAHATGRLGVAMVTRPGGHQHRHPACDAFMDSVPMVRITGQVSSALIGTDAFQECDTVGITRSAPLPQQLVTRAEDYPMATGRRLLHRHHRRPGPCWSTSPRTSSTP
ncbi:MAG: thiamine pyrophosphate-binding protein [Acidimicrobiales bacterium]